MVEKNIGRLWDQLLALIEEGRVIPIIGPELLLLDINGKTTLLYSYLAEQLANSLQIDSEPEDTLNIVVCRYLSQGGQREDIYPALKTVMPPLSQVTLPAALVKLAEIQPFKLFVTTSFDPYLAQVLNQVRYEGKECTQVLDLYTESKNDLMVPFKELDRATVFHLFGKLTATPNYAVTDEDILELMHTLQSKENRPNRLFDALVEENLIVIGCPLPDWLARFFVRINKKERLAVSGGKTDFLVGNQLPSETNLTEFLDHFSRRTKLFPLTSIEFVNELHHRWLALHQFKSEPVPDPEPIPEPGPISETDPMHRGAVFLSYAHEDRPAVELIRDALKQAGIEVWFDRNPSDLRAGDNFETRIKTNIDQCSLFVPIISRNTLTPRPRFFRLEWNRAQDRAELFPENWRFIIPVVIDDTPPEAENVPEHIRKLHWERIKNGQCSAEFLSEIKELQRVYRRDC